MPTRPARQNFILLVEERGAVLLDAQGHRSTSLGPLRSSEDRTAWQEALGPWVPPGSRVDLVLAHGQLQLQCHDVPVLSLREQREAAQRLALAEAGQTAMRIGSALLPDPGADGGYQLWVAAQPRAELEAWIAVLRSLKAELACVVPLSYLLARALPGLDPAGRDCLLLAVEPEGGRLFFFRGMGLAFTRSFRFPDGMTLQQSGARDEALLTETVSEELSRALQFIKQKHRGVALTNLMVLGLESLSPGPRLALEQALQLPLVLHGATLAKLLVETFRGERDRKDGLNLMPEELLEARRTRTLRAAVWVAAAAMLALCLGTVLVLNALEANKRQELAKAETLLEQRHGLAEMRKRALRERFPLARIRLAEARQAKACEQLERLALCLFDVPEGLTLASVEIQQMPGDPLTWRFTVTGSALSDKRFSVGPLAQFLARLKQQPGMRLSPLHEVSVSDRRLADGTEAPDQQAVTRFTLEGFWS